MSAIKSLKQLVKTLSSEERKVCRRFLQSIDSRGDKFDFRVMKFFDALVNTENDNLPDSDICFLVYGKNQNSAFSRLQLRLRDKILESLSLDVNIDRDGAYSECSNALYSCRKKIVQAQILKGRGLHDISEMLLEGILKAGKKYELYEELLTAIRLLIQIKAMNQGKRETDKLLVLYETYSKCQQALMKAQVYYYTLISTTEFKAQITDELEEVRKAVDEIHPLFSKTSSATVGFYLYYLETHYYQQKKQYRKAAKGLNQLADLIENHPALYSKQRLANAITMIAWNDIYLRRFKQAVDNCEKALRYYTTKSFNYIKSLETLFYAHFYNGKYTKALSVVERMQEDDTGEKATYRNGKRNYMKASTLFMLGRHKEANQLLLEINPIESDSEGWNVGVRFLTIMNDIELGRNDKADLRIETTRKHLKKIDATGELKSRQNKIYFLLNELVRESFNFKTVHINSAELLSQLSTKEHGLEWDVHTPELIIFHEWFIAKALNSSYTKQVIPPYSERVPSYIKLDSTQ